MSGPLVELSETVLTFVAKVLSVEYSRTDAVDKRPGFTDTDIFASLPVMSVKLRPVTVGSVPSVVNEMALLTVEPKVLVAVTVKVSEGKSTVGVPEIAPVEAEIESPPGSAGETLHVAGPPAFVGVNVVIALLSFPLIREGAYEKSGGVAVTTDREIVNVELPPKLVAVTT